jgi:beta-lactamase regulating signal transducer with metallopeptidase domain
MNLTQTLGWTLIHFLWEGTIVAILLACALVLLRRSRAQTRYTAGCAAMVLMVACAAGTFIELQFSSSSPREEAVSVAPISPGSGAPNATNPSTAVVTRGSAIADYLPLLVWAWFGGVVALSFRAFGGWMVASQLTRRYARPAEEHWQDRFSAVLERMRVSRPVKLAVSSTACVPAVVGWLKPVVLMPATVFTGLTVEQIEALIAHELAHVQRHDYAINLLQTAVETLLFYHPAVWWVGRCIRNERENCCDDLAVELCGNRAAYVRALTDLEELRGKTPVFAMAADGGSLLSRVERLLELKSHVHSTPSGLLAAVGIAVVCISVIGVKASSFKPQSSPAPAQEAAPAIEAPIEQPPPSSEPSASPLIAKAPQAAADPARSPAPQQAPPQQNSPDWLDQIQAAGFRDLKVDKLIEMKIHGVDGKYIQEIRAAGVDPSADKLIEMKIHGVDGEYVRQMQAAGVQLTVEEVVEMKIHGVTPEFIRDIKSLYPDITANKILEMKIHGVTPAYVRDAKSRFKDLTADQIIQLKIFNILK